MNSMYGINENVYNNLINYFKKNTNITNVILFGSRAKKNNKTPFETKINNPSKTRRLNKSQHSSFIIHHRLFLMAPPKVLMVGNETPPNL